MPHRKLTRRHVYSLAAIVKRIATCILPVSTEVPSMVCLRLVSSRVILDTVHCVVVLAFSPRHRLTLALDLRCVCCTPPLYEYPPPFILTIKMSVGCHCSRCLQRIWDDKVTCNIICLPDKWCVIVIVFQKPASGHATFECLEKGRWVQVTWVKI